MSDFVAGFTARHAAPREAMDRAFSSPTGFAAIDLCPQSAPATVGPRHFSPADRAHNPTAGWDPLDPGPQECELPAIDPVAAAREAGYAEGLAAAIDEAGERDRTLLAGLAEQLTTGRAIDRDLVADQLRQTVLTLVGKVIGEVGIAPDILARRIGAAADHLADTTETGLLRVHPDDVALLTGRLPTRLFAVGDPHVARGSFVLETASSVVEDGPALWLEQLALAIDRVGVPSGAC